MLLAPLRFNNYVWPHNPRIYEITYTRDVAMHKVPFGTYILQDMGRSYRVLKGEGEFVGAGAYDEFKKLASEFYKNKSGKLSHPLWQASTAYFVSLELKQEPVENYVRYSFEFWECDEQNGGETALTSNDGNAALYRERIEYIAAWGDSFWSIAVDNGLTFNELRELNPQIKNPYFLAAGDRVRIA